MQIKYTGSIFRVNYDDDEFEKFDGNWKITRRHVRMIDIEQGQE